MKFRKKPVVVDAVQWWPPGHSQHVPIGGVERGPREDQPWGVMTLDGFMVASPGDWIITGEKGEKYPCKHDVFVLTYEEVKEPTVGGVGLASMPEREQPDLESDAMP